MSKRVDPFEEFANAYDETVQSAIGAAGESVQYFADIKACLVRELLRNTSPARVLDFGCGVGNTTRALASALPSAAVIGVDVSWKSLTVARHLSVTVGQAAFVLGGVRQLPFRDGAFDVAFASCVFHHIDRVEHEAWVRELSRVLVQGGRLFVFEHNPLNPLTLRVVRNCPFDRGVVLLHADYTERLLAAGGMKTHEAHFYFFFPHILRWLRSLERYLRRLPFGAQYFVMGERTLK
jgi:ubiquinone/menaquinone biosynthesis C-methylase UbiE